MLVVGVRELLDLQSFCVLGEITRDELYIGLFSSINWLNKRKKKHQEIKVMVRSFVFFKLHRFVEVDLHVSNL